MPTTKEMKMKKIIAASAALFMAGSCLVAGNAMADDETGITVGGDARVRARYLSNQDFGNSDDDEYDSWDSRVRLNFKGQAAGGAYMVSRLILSDTTFNGGIDDEAGDDKNVWIDKAYLGIPFGDTFKLEAGKYRVDYGNLFLLEDIGMSGIRGFYTTDTVEIIPFYEVMKEGHSGDNAYDYAEDNDTLRFGAVLSARMDTWTAGFIAAYQTDDTTTENVDETTGVTTYTDNENEGFFGSVFASGDMGMFAVETEIAYAEEGLSDFNFDEDDGYGGYIRGTYKMDVLSVALEFTMTQDGFMPDVDYGYLMMGYDEPTTIVDIGEGGDWFIAGLRTNYAVTEALNLTGNLAYATVDAEDDNDDVDYFEVSGALAYNISKGATFSWFAGYLMPDFDDSTLEDDAAFATYGMFEVKF